MEILTSAHGHGVSDDDIRHAIENSVGVLIAPNRPDFAMVVGPDQASNLLEVGVISTDDTDFVIHAMPARRHYLWALRKE